MKTIKILLTLVSIFLILIVSLITGYNIKSKIKETKIGKELLKEIIEEAKTKYNFTMNKNDYEIEVIGHKGGYVFKSPPPVYGIKKKGISYRSKYFKELENMYYEITGYGTLIGFDEGRRLLKIVADFGLQPYILNTLIYDKTKGNNFEKIEQIFKKHEGKITYQIKSNIWECGGIESQFEEFYNLNYVNNINCREKSQGSEYYNTYNSEVMEEYGKRYEKYFSTPRSLETINWEEYMKIHEIYPIIKFYFDGTKEEREKLRKEIEPYYNKKILDIIIY